MLFDNFKKWLECFDALPPCYPQDALLCGYQDFDFACFIVASFIVVAFVYFANRFTVTGI